MVERFKSLVLALLVITSFVLTFKIALNEKLWPDGYNFFVDSRFSSVADLASKLNPFAKSGTGNASNSVLTVPNRVIVNAGGEQRYYITNKNSQHDAVDYQVKRILTALFSSLDVGIAADDAEVASALKTKSVYLDYITSYDTGVFAQYMNKNDSTVARSVSKFSGMIVSFSDTVKTNATVYIKDIQTNRYFKFDIPYAKADFDTIFKNIQNDEENLISYSADLGYDKKVEGQRILIESAVPIFLEPVEVNEIKGENPVLKANNEYDDNVIYKILRTFKINPNTYNKYTEADETMVFVENNATLKIHKNGVVEYNAKPGVPGIELVKQNASSFETMLAVSEFIDAVSKSAGIYHPLMQSPAYNDGVLRGADMQMRFDYLVNNTAVMINLSGGKSNPEVDNSVFVQVQSGAITKYIHLLRRYDNTENKVDTALVDKSLDAVFEQYRGNNADGIFISNIYPVYKYDDKTETFIAQWNINVDKVEINESEPSQE